MRALGNNVKIKQDPDKQFTKTGLIIPGNAKRTSYVWGEVEQIGDTKEDIQIGDRVYYSNRTAFNKQIVKVKDIFYMANKLKGKVLSGKILVLPKKYEEVTVGGIIIPKTARNDDKMGEIVVAGKNVEELEVGDTVYYASSGFPIQIENVDYVLLSKNDVMFVV